MELDGAAVLERRPQRTGQALVREAGQTPEGSPTALVHLDLYRLEDPASADELFAQEEEEAAALGAWLVVEWAERLSVVPQPCWRLELTLHCTDDPEAGRRAWLQETVFHP